MYARFLAAAIAVTVVPTSAFANATIAKLLQAPAIGSASTIDPPAPRSRMPFITKPSQLPSEPDGKNAVGGPSGVSSSSIGRREVSPEQVVTVAPAKSTDLSGTQAFGQQKHPFATKNAFGSMGSTHFSTTDYYPWRATGKLWMRYGSSWFVCTASMIKKGIAVTAAHCVHRYGQKTAGWPNEVYFEPARFFGITGYSRYYARYVRVPKVYYNGFDSCSVKGVVCENDVAVITFYPNADVYPGTVVGWYAYAWNNGFYTSFLGKKAAQITQLGYPGALNGGSAMVRTDSLGYQASPFNVLIGSSQTGGSSGGPWLVNFGNNVSGYVAGSNNPAPSADKPNVVIATTSWGYNDGKQKLQGASRFANNSKFPNAGRSNIQALVNDACAQVPAAC